MKTSPDAMTPAALSPRVAEIISHESDAEKLQADADAHCWEAARLISEELSTGTSQKVLAYSISKSQPHVSKCAAVWAKYGDYSLANRPLWADAYHEKNSKAPKPTPTPDAPSPTPERRPVLTEDDWVFEIRELLTSYASVANDSELAVKKLHAMVDEVFSEAQENS